MLGRLSKLIGLNNNSITLSRGLRGAFPFIIPGILYLFIIIVYPIFYTIYLSLTNMSLVWPGYDFIGLGNYVEIITDPEFLVTLENTFFFVSVGMSITIIGGMFLALLFNQNIPGRSYARAAVVVPWVLCMVIVGLTWKWMFNDQFGLINAFLGEVGISKLSWLSEPWLARWSILIAVIWQSLAYSMIFIQAALQGISKNIYEAAVVDGANKLQTFFYITLPMLKPTLLVLVILVSLHRFNMFALNLVLTGGGPGNATNVLGLYMYEQAFQVFNFGYGSAVAICMVVINLIFTAIYIKLFRAN